MDALDALIVISLVASSIGAVLAIVAIVLTLILFLASHRTSLDTLKYLSEIKVSTHVTEKTTTEQMATMQQGLIEIVSDRAESSAALEKTRILENVGNILSGEDGIVDDDARRRLRYKMEDAVNSAFHSLTYNLTKIQPQPQASTGGIDLSAAKAAIHPSATQRVLEWIRNNEANYAFLGVKYMRDTIFQADAAAREALQYCIDVGMLELYKVDNPDNAAWKTTACRLNRSNDAIQAMLLAD